MANLDGYFGTLATEYYLLKQAGKDVTAVLNEIYYGIEMIDRLDLFAEPFFDINAALNSNGFCTRDDVLHTTVNEFENEYVKTEDTRDRLDGLYSDAHKDNELIADLARNEPSQDQYIGAYMGFAQILKWAIFLF